MTSQASRHLAGALALATATLLAACDLQITPASAQQKRRSRLLLEELHRSRLLPAATPLEIEVLPTYPRSCANHSPPTQQDSCINVVVVGANHVQANAAAGQVAATIGALRIPGDSDRRGAFASVTAFVKTKVDCGDGVTPRRLIDCYEQGMALLRPVVP